MSLSSALRRVFFRGHQPGKQDQDETFRTVVEQSADVICRATNGRFSYVSPSVEKIFGWDSHSLIGRDGLDLVYQDDQHIVLHIMAEAAAGRIDGSTSQIRVICRDGSLKWTETTSRTEFRGGAEETVLVMRDITERKRLEEELALQALQDGLTGLANRRSFDQTLERAWDQTLREGGQMALLLLDIDHFKQFNDTYGHQAGDDCIRAVAACVKQHVHQPTDLACRYGGEEIAVILGSSNMEAATEIAETIRSAIEALGIPHKASACGDTVTVSIGIAAAIARAGGSIRMPEGLLQASDHALYRAKAEGRNRVASSLLIAPTT